ncbi:extracellular solute-binding protein [Microbacterium sp. NPDC096154]|uniref:extracellular solute-binding protein n=1 Tax=Microbacterium sp. NPDC096154 TaxID=3155549 RepID=UPI00331F5552
MQRTWKKAARIGGAALGAVSMLAATACSSGSGGEGAGGDEAVTLTIASWGDPFTSATRTHLAEPFAEETGYDVQIVDAPGKFVATLESQIAADNVEWDILDSTSAPDAYVMYDRGMIDQMPDDVKERLLEVLPEDAVTDFGITWSILGYITACNQAAVEACPSNTEEYFDTEAFPGSRTSISTSPLVNLSLAEIANGVPIEDLATHEIDLDAAFATLEKVKAETGVWWNSGDQSVQVMTNEEADMGVLYSGRAYTVNEEIGNTQLNWEDGLYNPGFMNVVEGSGDEDAAWEFIEWIATHPENAAAWASELGYSVPNPEAFDFIDPAIAETLPDFPANREQLAAMNFDWYVENFDEVNARWQEFLRG